MWTLDELVRRAGAALAAEYPGAPNGRVRDLPDRRSIRWYTQTGLVDRPAGVRGRIALYGPRHLLQLVALKRRQAGGLSLAQIQAELTGASDAELAAIARVPASLLAGDPATVGVPATVGDPAAAGASVVADAALARPRFWAAPSAGATSPGATSPGVTSPGAPPAGEPADRPVGERAAPPSRAGGRYRGAPPLGAEKASTLSSAATASTASTTDAAARPVGGVALGGGAILILPGTLTPADAAAVTAAAGPLMTLLADRGLLNQDQDTGRAS